MRKLIESFFFVGLSMGVLVLLFSYQNCAPIGKRAPAAFSNPSLPVSPSGYLAEAPRFVNFQQQILSDCKVNLSVDACLFYKNPLAQQYYLNGPSVTSLSPAPAYSKDYSSIQNFGVLISDLDNSGYLQNQSFQITIYPGASGENRQRARRNASGLWKFDYANDPNHRVAQLMAYYYSHAEEVYFQKRLGGFYASYKSIDIDAFNDDPEDLDKNGKPDSENNAYFYSSGGDNGHVMLGHFKNWTSSSGESEAALSAEILVHELGHANLYHASQASRGNLTPFCSSTQTQGCIGAIHEGQADFHTFILFPQSPTAVGELLVNSTGGLSECGIPRSPDRLSKTGSNCTSNSGCFLTLSIANGISCGGGSREVHIMGRIYALIWYDAWISATDRREVEILFNEHLSKISYSDDFRTAVQKAMDVDRTLGNGSIATLLKQKAEGRGITGLN